MDARTVIDSYVNNVAAQLPRRTRNDVGLELRTLLADQLAATAADEAREPDGELALEVVHRFGRPEEVAARYHRRGFEIIEPGHAPAFVMLSATAVAIHWAVTLPAVFTSRLTFGEWWLRWGLSAFAWVGFLVLWFGLAAWVRRRNPVGENQSRPWTHHIFWVPLPADWRPGEPEAGIRRAGIGAFPLGVAVTIFFIAPVWFLDLLTPAGTDTSWAAYDAGFRRGLLPPLIALMVARLGLFAMTLLDESWRARLEGLRFGLWVCFVALLCWALFRRDIFANPLTDALFKVWLLVFLVVNTIQIVLWIRRAQTRVRVPRSHLGVL